jgi:crossover junction endodeoxyribonuclease RuvC
MRIIGIDPGSGGTGYGIIETDGSTHRLVLYGAIQTSSKKLFHERLLKIHSELNKVLACERADAMAIEEVFYAVNVQAALRLGHARGVALLAAAEHGLSVHEYSPLEIKSAVVGYGRADKFQIQAMVRLLLKLPELPSPDHAADALAVAICHANRIKLSGR